MGDFIFIDQPLRVIPRPTASLYVFFLSSNKASAQSPCLNGIAYGESTCAENYGFHAFGDNVAQILSYADFTSPDSIDAQMICSRQMLPGQKYCADATVSAFDPSLCNFHSILFIARLNIVFDVEC
jgi:hypothetical protein